MTLDKYLTIAECLPQEQEPCEDAISRQAAIDALKNLEDLQGRNVFTKNGLYPWNVIAQLPSVTPKQRTGHWISHYDEDEKVGWYECGRCHTERAFNTDYCPDCGAKMEE